MSPQEVQILQNFLDQLVQVRGVTQDPQAAALIGAATARQPDAAYLLVQRALLMEQALNAANSQIAALQAELSEQKALNSNGGRSAQFFDTSANAWGNSASNRGNPAAQAPVSPAPAMASSVTGAPLTAYPQSSGYVPPAAAPLAGTPAGSSFFGGSTGSMLGSVAATAAGVAAGAFLYQGISHLLNPASHAAFASGNMLTPDTGSASQLTSSGDGLQSGYFDQQPVSDNSSFTDVQDDQSYGDDDSDLI